jgi:cytochrome P450
MFVSRTEGNIPQYTFTPRDLIGDQSGPMRLARFSELIRGQKMIKMRFGPRLYSVVNDPEAIERVLHSNAKAYKKSDGYDELRPVLGDGLLNSEGETWKRNRRLMGPAFHQKALAGVAAQIAAMTDTMMDEWQEHCDSGEPFDLAAEMSKLTLTIVGQALFGVDLSEDAGEVGEALAVVLRYIDGRMISLFRLPQTLPLPKNVRFRRAIGVLNNHVAAVLKERRGQPARETPDLLEMLLAAQDERGGLTDTQLRDEVMTLILAGHETTATALAWAFQLLSLHPQINEKLLAEHKELFANWRSPAFEDVPRMRYTAQVLQETMRLRPPVWIIERQAISADTLCGQAVVPGERVTIAPYLIHRHPEHWENPEGFDPERFTPARSQGRAKAAYIPFGAGPRQCIGSLFAMMEAQIILARVVARYRVELLPGALVEPELMLTLRPKGGVPVTIKPRAGH